MNQNWKDVIGGGFFAGLGLYVLITAFSFGLGSAERMGAGYYPMILGATAIVLGLIISMLGLREPGIAPVFAGVPLLAVVSGLVAFVLLIDWAGLMPAIWGLIGLSSLAEEEKSLASTATLALVFSLAAWLLFTVGLKLPVAGIKGVM